MAVQTSGSTAEDGTASSVRNFSQSAGCSTEQILTPVSIKKLKSSSDPTPGFRPAFSSMNEDGNFGGTAAIHEMIIQSTKNNIILLPALPKEWDDGYLHGAKVKGAATVNLDWKAGKPNRFEITANMTGYFNIIFKEKYISIELKAGQVLVLNEADFD